jgi:hypothetical protein
MVPFCARSRAVFLAAALAAVVGSAVAAVPDYKLGEVATEDVVTPVPLLVVNPEATEALRQKIAQQVVFVVRFTPRALAEAEREVQDAVGQARGAFADAMKEALGGRQPVSTDIGTPAYTRVLAKLARSTPKGLPLERFAPLWLRYESDDPLVQALLQPVREVMAQPVVANKTDNAMPNSQSVRLLPMKSLTEPPSTAELEASGTTVSAAKVLGLMRARRLVETAFPAGQEAMGKFAATYVRINAAPDPELTNIIRARRMEGVTANDAYEAAQVIVRKGQTVDRKAASALAAMREKSMIGTLQTKLAQEQTVAVQITSQTKWIAGGLGLVCLALAVILWRLRNRPSSALVTVGPNPALPGAEWQALPGGGDESWRSRALAAEGKAERAQQAIRTGVLGWMKEKVFHSVVQQREQMLSVQQKAEQEMRELEQRLEQLHAPLQERIAAYEKRIEELEQDLAVKGEENRQLIGARIAVARQHLSVERERGRFGTN